MPRSEPFKLGGAVMRYVLAQGGQKPADGPRAYFKHTSAER